MWQQQMGAEKTERVLKGFKQEKRTYIRCNTVKSSVEQIRNTLEKENVKVTRVQDIPYALEIKDMTILPDWKALIWDFIRFRILVP